MENEIIDMTAQEWFENGSMFTLDFLLPEERETIYKIMDLYAQGKVRFKTQEQNKKLEYWKQRCEAAEENIRTYSEWHTDELTCDHIHENASKTFATWEEAFKKWQSLKSQEPNQ